MGEASFMDAVRDQEARFAPKLISIYNQQAMILCGFAGSITVKKYDNILIELHQEAR